MFDTQENRYKKQLTKEKSQLSKRKRVAIYIRVSTQEQAAEGHSMEAQEARAREHAERIDYEITDVYIDEGISGKSIKQPVFQRMMADARMGNFDISTSSGKLMLQLLGSFGECERN